MNIEFKTNYFDGSDFTGSDGDLNRVLQIGNSGLTTSDGFFITLDGAVLSINSDYTVVHKIANTEITVLIPLWDSQKIVANFSQQTSVPSVGDSGISGDRVTYSNLFSQSRANVVNVISSNISDPISSSSEFRKWIYSRMPDVKDGGFKGYPLIIIEPSGVNVIQEESSADGKKKIISWDIVIEIRTSDRGYGSADGKGLTYIDSIGDSIMENFLSMEIRNYLGGNNLRFSTPISDSVETIVQENELIYRRIIRIGFRNLMAISA